MITEAAVSDISVVHATAEIHVLVNSNWPFQLKQKPHFEYYFPLDFILSKFYLGINQSQNWGCSLE